MSSEPRSIPVSTIAAALLRTGAWIYLGLWLIVAAAAPWGPPGVLPVLCLLPLAPLVFLATIRSLLPDRSDLPRPTAERKAEAMTAAHAFLSSPLDLGGAPAASTRPPRRD